MHIQRIALKNFKCFKEVAVDFSRITLLFEEVSFNHDLKSQLGISLDFSFDWKFKAFWYFDNISKSPKLSLLEVGGTPPRLKINQKEDLSFSVSVEQETFSIKSIDKDLGIVYDIKPHRLSGGRFEIKVKIKSRSKWDFLADVGFGISQFLPILGY